MQNVKRISFLKVTTAQMHINCFSLKKVDVMKNLAQGIMGSCCEALLNFWAEIVLNVHHLNSLG